ncbi:helix-turn-helix domain-containing protein [Neobacillus sp. FSL H8-0543]|uniref:helix-turn-helix domain-containing protein n=1 Tax=Neobacillus sp. FSL H8-0543 TaxID=2954672 RepID=UPI00315866D5
MEGKWLIADRDLNEREGLKWLLKTSSIPVTNILLASNYQEFVVLFEEESPEIILLELDMISRESWSSFKDLMRIYDPVLLLTSAEATFEKARLSIDMQALDLMIKPFSAAKVKSAFQKAASRLSKRNHPKGSLRSHSYKDISYEALFIQQAVVSKNYSIAAFKTESVEKEDILYSFLSDYPFKEIHGIFPLSDLVLLLFEESYPNIVEQCQKVMRKWEEEYSDPLAIVIHKGTSLTLSLHEKYIETRKMLQFTYYRGYRQVVVFEYTPDWVHIDPFLTPPEQREWIEMLSNLDLESIKKWLYDQFLQLIDPYPEPGLVRIRLTSILAQIRRYMKTFNLDEDLHCEKEYRYIFHSILYDSVLYRSVQNLIIFIQKIFAAAELSLKNNKQDPIERGITFMEANFSNYKLRLDDVARYVDRNPSYYSHILISKTGKSFVEVLTGIRIKEAKRLLIETRNPIKEISKLVGFQNSNYFSRIFKEVVGSSPREFRVNISDHY